jgi:hypothetical protein
MGWLVAGRRPVAALFAAMGLLMAVGPGHILPLFGSEATGPQLFEALVLTFVPMAAAAVVLADAALLWPGGGMAHRAVSPRVAARGLPLRAVERVRDREGGWR